MVDQLNTEPANTKTATVLICHTSKGYVEQLGREFRARGHLVTEANNGKALRAALASQTPQLLVAELRLADGPTLGQIEQLREACPQTRVVIVTDHGSIASAVRCSQLGVSGYFTERVTASQIEEGQTAIGRAPAPLVVRPIRLDRAVWEYLNRVVDSTGSIAGAADVLGIDRRSLRRMLNKSAPPP